MPRDSKIYLEDILQAIDKIRRYTHGYTIDALRRDEKTLDAVVRNLEIIGEAVKQLPDEIRQRHGDVEWKRIAGLRDILIHAYFGIDVEIVWDVVQNKLPILSQRVEAILSE